MKKLFCIIMSVLLVSGMSFIAASAEDRPQLTGTLELLTNGDIPEIPSAATLTTVKKPATRMLKAARAYTPSLEEQLCQIIYDSISQMQTSIDISSLMIDYTQENFDVIASWLNYIINTTPELFMKLYGNIGTTYFDSDTVIFATIEVNYSTLKADYDSQRAEYDVELTKIVGSIPENLSDLEKVLYTYNYLALNYQYDFEYSIYDAYNIFTQKKGVCQAYSLAFIAIMNELGIPSTLAIDAPDNHAWNIVEIGGKAYNIDCTFADPVPDRVGNVGYDYFLLSDDTIHTMETHTEHYTYEESLLGVQIVCSDTFYESDHVWFDSAAVTPLTYCNGEWYYMCYDDIVNEAMLYKANESLTDSSATTLTVTDKWPAYEDGVKIGAWSGYFGSMFTFGDTVCYNTPNEIYSYDPVTEETYKVMDYNPVNKFSIYGCTYDGHGNITLATKLGANDDESRTNVSLTIGDINRDKRVNAYDLLAVKKYIISGTCEGNWAFLDTSGDIGIDVRDLIAVKKLTLENK